MHDESDISSPICEHCCQINAPETPRCSECNSPLGDFASTAPWEMGTARSSAYPPIRNSKTKPIIFWGIWMLFGPAAYHFLRFACFTSFRMLTEGGMTFHEDGEIMGGLILVTLFSFLCGLLSVWVLWSVTKVYLKKNKKLS